MRVKKVTIRKWRHFRDIEIEPPADARMVCLVGENGSGKSSILELIARTAPQARLAMRRVAASSGQTVDQPGDEYEVVWDFNGDKLREELDPDDNDDWWDGTVQVSRSPGSQSTSIDHSIRFGFREGFDELGREPAVWRALEQTSERPLCLLLGPDRVIPRLSVNSKPSTLSGSSFRIDFTAMEVGGQLLSEWEESQRKIVGEHDRKVQEAVDNQMVPPKRPGPLSLDISSLESSIPELLSARVEVVGSESNVLFETAAETLGFSDLCSGWKDLVFLNLYLERSPMGRPGVLLFDSPELHLNHDLVRQRLQSVLDDDAFSQTWIATHAYEVVEIAGERLTCVLTRSKSASDVESFWLVERGLYATLAAVLGMPGFSIAGRRFLYVEGQPREEASDRRRFAGIIENMIDGGLDIKAVGGWATVKKDVDRMKDLLNGATPVEREQLRFGGVVDRDHRTEEQVKELQARELHVLGCFEIENVFLHPSSLARLTGRDESDIHSIIREAADTANVGKWIHGEAKVRPDSGVKDEDIRPLVQKTWADFGSDPVSHIVDLLHKNGGTSPQGVDSLRAAAERFAELRTSDDWWKFCDGKSALPRVESALGYDSSKLESELFRLWQADDQWPTVVEEIRQFVRSLGRD